MLILTSFLHSSVHTPPLILLQFCPKKLITHQSAYLNKQGLHNSELVHYMGSSKEYAGLIPIPEASDAKHSG
jgi:hypothetical protein